MGPSSHDKVQHYLSAGWLDTPRNRAQPTLLCWLSVADCKEPPELEHGFVTFSSRNNLTTYRAAIQYHCQHPYYHMAPNSTGEQWGWAPSPQHGAGGSLVMHVCICKWGGPWDGHSGMHCKQQAVDVAYTHHTPCRCCLDCQTGHILLRNKVGWS